MKQFYRTSITWILSNVIFKSRTGVYDNKGGMKEGVISTEESRRYKEKW